MTTERSTVSTDEVPEKIRLSKNMIIFAVRNERSDSLEYILKDSFVEMHKLHCEQMQAIRQNEREKAIKPIVEVYEKYKGGVNPKWEWVLDELWQAIKKTVEDE